MENKQSVQNQQFISFIEKAIKKFKQEDYSSLKCLKLNKNTFGRILIVSQIQIEIEMRNQKVAFQIQSSINIKKTTKLSQSSFQILVTKASFNNAKSLQEKIDHTINQIIRQNRVLLQSTYLSFQWLKDIISEIWRFMQVQKIDHIGFQNVDQTTFNKAFAMPSGCSLAIGSGNIVAITTKILGNGQNKAFRSLNSLLNYMDQKQQEKQECVQQTKKNKLDSSYLDQTTKDWNFLQTNLDTYRLNQRTRQSSTNKNPNKQRSPQDHVLIDIGIHSKSCKLFKNIIIRLSKNFKDLGYSILIGQVSSKLPTLPLRISIISDKLRLIQQNSKNQRISKLLSMTGTGKLQNYYKKCASISPKILTKMVKKISIPSIQNSIIFTALQNQLSDKIIKQHIGILENRLRLYIKKKKFWNEKAVILQKVYNMLDHDWSSMDMFDYGVVQDLLLKCIAKFLLDAKEYLHRHYEQNSIQSYQSILLPKLQFIKITTQAQRLQVHNLVNRIDLPLKSKIVISRISSANIAIHRGVQLLNNLIQLSNQKRWQQINEKIKIYKENEQKNRRFDDRRMVVRCLKCDHISPLDLDWRSTSTFQMYCKYCP